MVRQYRVYRGERFTFHIEANQCALKIIWKGEKHLRTKSWHWKVNFFFFICRRGHFCAFIDCSCMSSEQKPNFLFLLQNRCILTLHGAVDVSYHRFGPFLILIRAEELPLFLRNLKSIASFLHPSEWIHTLCDGFGWNVASILTKCDDGW